MISYKNDNLNSIRLFQSVIPRVSHQLASCCLLNSLCSYVWMYSKHKDGKIEEIIGYLKGS